MWDPDALENWSAGGAVGSPSPRQSVRTARQAPRPPRFAKVARGSKLAALACGLAGAGWALGLFGHTRAQHNQLGLPAGPTAAGPADASAVPVAVAGPSRGVGADTAGPSSWTPRPAPVGAGRHAVTATPIQRPPQTGPWINTQTPGPRRQHGGFANASQAPAQWPCCGDTTGPHKGPSSQKASGAARGSDSSGTSGEEADGHRAKRSGENHGAEDRKGKQKGSHAAG